MNENQIETFCQDSITHTSSKFESITTIIPISEDYSDESIKDLRDMSFLLSIFDNIVGPKIVQYWKLENNSENTCERQFSLDDCLLKYISVHTLNGELYQDKMMGQVKYRLYLIQEVNCAVFSIFFDACTVETCNYNNLFNNHSSKSDSSSLNSTNRNTEQNYQTLNNCLSVILPLDKKHIFLKNDQDNTKFFINMFENIIMEFKVLAHVKPKISKITTAIRDLTQMLTDVCRNLFTLSKRGLLTLANQFNKETNQTETTKKILIKDTFMNDMFFTSATHSIVNNEFLIKAISSHLITNFNTIVVGKTSTSVNKMINTLAIFMPSEKLKLSCYALEELSMLCPYFFLQGFVTENPEEFNSIIDADFLFKRNFPTTIIDISCKTVCRTCISKNFLAKKEEFLNKKVQFLFNSLRFTELNSIYSASNYLNWISYTSVSNRSAIITNLLKQLDVFETDFGVKQSFVDLAIKELYLIALNLIEYINQETTNPSNRREKCFKLSVKKVCKDLQISNEEDLNIGIAYATLLKPELFHNVTLLA